MNSFRQTIKRIKFTECKRKVAYNTIQEAHAAAKKHGKRYKKIMGTYSCVHCGRFHLTTILGLNEKDIINYLTELGWKKIEKRRFTNGQVEIKVNYGTGRYQDVLSNGLLSKTRAILKLSDE